MIGEEVIAVYGDAGDGEELFEVQKLVRCNECKHYKLNGACMRLDRKMLAVRSNDFCSYENSSEKPNNLERSSE